MNLVFVYGTLRSGFGNHSLLSSSKFLGKGKTRKKYALYQVGIPFLVENESHKQIVGELYSVSSRVLLGLDMLEGHPKWYQRKKSTIIVNGKNYRAWIYFNKPQGELIESGDYAELNI